LASVSYLIFKVSIILIIFNELHLIKFCKVKHQLSLTFKPFFFVFVFLSESKK
jgi:hypothetical protein